MFAQYEFFPKHCVFVSFGKKLTYRSADYTINSVNKGITREEICQKTGIASSGNLTRKLDELEKCGFIRKYIPFGYKTKKRRTN